VITHGVFGAVVLAFACRNFARRWSDVMARHGSSNPGSYDQPPRARRKPSGRTTDPV
jgi:hypothetical protein